MSSAEKLTIETPELTELEFPLAGIGSRFLALAIDTLLELTTLAALGILIELILPARLFQGLARQWAFATLILVTFVVEFGYFAFFETVWRGQTPGKRWTQLRVMKDSGRPIGAQDAILRNLLRIVDYLPSLYAVGIITVLISRENKRLGDYVAGTVVVHEELLRNLAATWGETTKTEPVAPQRLPVLTADELQLVETFLERRDSFEPDVRWSMARQIADRLGQRWSVAPEARPDSEKFLEALVEARRSAARSQ